MVGTGFVFSFLFHWGTVEPLTGLPVARESDEDQRRLGMWTDCCQESLLPWQQIS